MPVSSTVAPISRSDIDCDRECELCLGSGEYDRNSDTRGGFLELRFSLELGSPGFWHNREFLISGDDSNDEGDATSGDEQNDELFDEIVLDVGEYEQGLQEMGFVKKFRFMVDKSIRSMSGKSARSIDLTGYKRSEFGGDKFLMASVEMGLMKIS